MSKWTSLVVSSGSGYQDGAVNKMLYVEALHGGITIRI
jgi:hypothetical protein